MYKRQRQGRAEVAPHVADQDVFQVERVKYQLDFPPDQGGVDFVEVAEERHCRHLGHGPCLGEQKGLPQQLWAHELRRGHPGETLYGRLGHLGVLPAVIGLLEPGGEAVLEGLQPGYVAVGHFDQELLAHCPEKPFYLAPAFGPPRPAVDQPHPKHGLSLIHI